MRESVNTGARLTLAGNTPEVNIKSSKFKEKAENEEFIASNFFREF